MRKDGSLTWVHLTITAQRDSEGRPIHFITMVQDINARKQAEDRLAVAQESLRKSEERYRTAFQMTMDAVALNRMDDGRYLDCNLAFLSVTGYTREEVIGRTSVELGMWADPRDRLKMIEMVQETGVCRNFEAQFRKKNGDFLWGMMSATVIDLDNQPCLLSITRDMSEAKTAENEIKRLAFYDPLTGLPNRRMLIERLRQALIYDRRNSRKRALLFVDLDNFKTLNDTLGHDGRLAAAGSGAAHLRLHSRGDTAARIGGDEFVVVLEEPQRIRRRSAASQAKHRGRERSWPASPNRTCLSRRECDSTSSIGITVFGKRTRAERDAAAGRYRDVPGQGRGAQHHPLLCARPAGRRQCAGVPGRRDLARAIRDNQFCLWYQPQVDGGRIDRRRSAAALESSPARACWDPSNSSRWRRRQG